MSPHMGNLTFLRRLGLQNNSFHGEIHPEIGRLFRLQVLNLSTNFFEGQIPTNLTHCSNLTDLDLIQNQLQGRVPAQFSVALPLILAFGFNKCSGKIPSSLGNLSLLLFLDLEGNNFHGKIPCVKLMSLSLEGNLFSGGIPKSLASLRGLEHIDLSRNKLSCQIPAYLGELTSLIYLNVFFNNLVGEVPAVGIFQNATAVSVLGNHNLCGGVPEFKIPRCQSSSSEKKGNHLRVKVIAPVLAAIFGLSFVSCLMIIHHYIRKKATNNLSAAQKSFNEQFLRISYSDLHIATSGLSESNIIGIGSYGTVYKAVLEPGGLVVAVKVLNLNQRAAANSFVAECLDIEIC